MKLLKILRIFCGSAILAIAISVLGGNFDAGYSSSYIDVDNSNVDAGVEDEKSDFLNKEQLERFNEDLKELKKDLEKQQKKLK